MTWIIISVEYKEPVSQFTAAGYQRIVLSCFLSLFVPLLFLFSPIWSQGEDNKRRWNLLWGSDWLKISRNVFIHSNPPLLLMGWDFFPFHNPHKKERCSKRIFRDIYSSDIWIEDRRWCVRSFCWSCRSDASAVVVTSGEDGAEKRKLEWKKRWGEVGYGIRWNEGRWREKTILTQLESQWMQKPHAESRILIRLDTSLYSPVILCFFKWFVVSVGLFLQEERIPDFLNRYSQDLRWCSLQV